MKKSVLTKAENRIFTLTNNEIEQLDKSLNGTELYNVISELENEFYGVLNYSDDYFYYYHISNFKELKGYGIRIKLSDTERNHYIFIFSKFISQEIEKVDEIICFNALQRISKGVIEKLGFLTYSEFPKYKGTANIAMKPNKGLIYVPLINRFEHFKKIFNKREYLDNIKENKVYLMFNNRNNLIKIGRSTKPIYREKTLQSQEPEIIILASWIAPMEIETVLKKKFYEKRKRGEWFDLKADDLIIIKKIMNKFKKIKIKTAENK